jgi:hypothetical protein
VPGVRSGSIAVVVLLALVAAAGFVVVRELTEPAPRQPIGPIQLDPGAQAGEPVEDEGRSRRQRRAGGRDREGGFAPPSRQPAEPGPAATPETQPPQIEVQTPPAGDDDDGGDD